MRPVLVTFAVAAGCCPPPEPQYVATCKPAPVPVARAQTSAQTQTQAQVPARPRNLPAPVLGRFQKPDARPDATAEPPKREMITEPPVALPGPKVEEVPVQREPLVPSKPLAPADRLPDEIVMRLLETGRAAFVRCFKKAIAADPTEVSFKVELHVELDDKAAITSSRTDSTNPTLNACLVRSAAWLKFPATGRRVVVELPLFYRAE